MPKQLTAQTATITTAAVEVKTLTVSGKQVTLAVFRQLREEPLIAEDGTLNGVPWGYVNYHPDKCGGDRHWHVVWQQGDELLRSRVEKELDEEAHSDPALDQWITAAVREALHGRPTGFPDNGSPITSGGNEQMNLNGRYVHDYGDFIAMRAESRWRRGGASPITWTGAAHTLAVRAASLTKENFKRGGGFYTQEDVLAAGPGALVELDQLVDGWGRTYREIQAAGQALLDVEADRRTRHRNLRKSLADLPQLFIAV